jgi:hypothetical protein
LTRGSILSLVLHAYIVYHRNVNAACRIVRGWLPSLVTFVAALGLLARLSAPLPVQPATGVDASLAGLGATLCHMDGGGDQGVPLKPIACDHCELCDQVIPVLPPPAAVPKPAVVATVMAPAKPGGEANPRAPPRRANNPRAPPTLV